MASPDKFPVHRLHLYPVNTRKYHYFHIFPLFLVFLYIHMLKMVLVTLLKIGSSITPYQGSIAYTQLLATPLRSSVTPLTSYGSFVQ